MRGEHVVGDNRHQAIPGGNTGPNSAWKFRTPAGYQTRDQMNKFEGGLADGLVAHRAAQKAGEETNFQGQEATGTSIFDPVLCELAYRWFCPPGGLVLDPFAGGSVRGVVASKLGRQYVGIDLRAEQVAANKTQADIICGEPQPKWIIGDSRDICALAPTVEADFILSCPPYGDLERYSDDPRDLSTLEYEQFRPTLAGIIDATCSLLKPDRFACFVVGDFRDRRTGFYRGFPAHTIAAFEAAGLRLYNEAILVTAVGSLPVRVGKQFASTRKLGKTHQNVLIFCKGDPRAATEAIGEVEYGDVEGMPQAGAPLADDIDLGGQIV